MRTLGLKQLAASLLVIGSLAGMAAGCAAVSGRETAGQYIDDSAITTSVKSELAENVGLQTTAQINVETMQGVVQLSGFVDKAQDKVSAEQITRRVKGVQDVHNSIIVRG